MRAHLSSSLAMVGLILSCSACGSRTGLGSFAPGAETGPTSDGAARDELVASDLPAPDSTPVPSSYAEQAARACTVGVSALSRGSINSCIEEFGYLGWPMAGTIMGPTQTLAQRLIDCAARVVPMSAYSSFVSCFGGTWATISECQGGARCDPSSPGSRMVRSGDKATYLDCAALGATCADLPKGTEVACCQHRACSGGVVAECDGTKGFWCTNVPNEKPVGLEFDCAPTGRVCRANAGSWCQGTGAACADTQPTTCQGSTATYCSGGKLATYDCRSNPFRTTCDPKQSPIPCRAAGSTAPKRATCEGLTTVVVALNGFPLRIDCRDLGFEICLDASSANGARCGFLLD